MRLFIALRLSEGAKMLLAGIQDKLREQGVTGNYTDCKNLHLTLAFIGEYDRPEKVMRALRRVRLEPFELHVGGRLGSFGELIWVGISGAQALTLAANDVRSALESESIPFDRKPFKPHITIIRRAAFIGKGSVGDVKPPSVCMPVERISLMRSDRINGKLVYTEIGAIRAGECSRS